MTIHQVSVLCGPSANLETTIRADLPPGPYKPGRKNLVKSIETYRPDMDRVSFQVTLLGGEILTFEASDEREVSAGSSINVAMALQQWGIKVGVFAPIGTGHGGRSLTLAMDAKKVPALLFTGMADTPRTLTVNPLDGGESTLFLVKPPYCVPPPVLDAVLSLNPKVTVATGVKSHDLDLIVPVFRKTGEVFRAFTPSNELLVTSRDNEHVRKVLLELVDSTTLLQVNRDEAALLFGLDETSQVTRESVRRFGQEHMIPYLVVTLGGKGAWLYEDTMEEVIHQEALRFSEDVYTSGPGDAHLAALIYALIFLTERDPKVSLEVAAFVAGHKCQHVGPWSGLPSLKVIEDYLENHV